MRWWHRLLVTLILAPLLWRLGVCYIASQQGSTWPDLAQQSLGVLLVAFLTFTLPALALCFVLLASDRLLHALGLDLMTVLVSPLIAFGIAWAVLHFVREPHVQAAEGALSLAVFYGLVWGLTIREPRRVRPTGEADTIEGTPA